MIKQPINVVSDIETVIEVGDTKQEALFPQVKAMWWNNECNFSVRLVDDEAQVWVDGDKVKMSGSRYDGEIYGGSIVMHGKEIPSHNISVIFKSKPSNNVIDFSIKHKGVGFYRQPDSDEFYEVNPSAGWWVVAADKADGKYKTGQTTVIPRPSAVDASGDSVLCDLVILPQDEVMQIHVPAEFLETAVYPVVVG